MNISAVKENFEAALRSATSLEKLDELRVRFTGKKGDLTLLLKSLGKLLPELRKQAGIEVNKLRDEIEAKLDLTAKNLRNAENQKKENDERIDVTLPSRGRTAGAFHPVMQTIDRKSVV